MLTLVENGRCRCRIVVPLDVTRAERHAAKELRRLIAEMSGANVPIAGQRSTGETNVLIGRAAGTAPLPLGYDGYFVRTSGRDLALAGRRDYSTIYAVNHLAERHLGCGFFEDGEQIPRLTNVVVPEIDDVCEPRFECRSYAICMADAYSGMRWWDWPELRAWMDYLVRKRFNLIRTERFAEHCGIMALAARKLGVHIELTDWQKKRLDLLRRTFDYARMQGIRMLYFMGIYGWSGSGRPGTYAYMDGVQRDELVRRYNETHGEKIPTIDYEWCGLVSKVMDPRHPVTQQYITASVEAYTEALGTDHLYGLWLPSEGGWAGDDYEEMNRVTRSMTRFVADAIRKGDPQPDISVQPPFAYSRTFEAQKEAVRESGLKVAVDAWLHSPGRKHDFMFCDYFWGLPWVVGMTGQCGKETNLEGELVQAVRNAQELIADPRASECFGFHLSSETNHRAILKMDFYAELMWNPVGMELSEYLKRWTARRYGSELAAELHPATEDLAATVYSCINSDVHNGPLYRYWGGTYLPGLTPTSVKRTLGYLPQLKTAIQTMLRQHERLATSDLYRFDLIDIGRVYLAATFNDRFGRARKALRTRDLGELDRQAAAVEEVMHFTARWCSAHPQFRLKTHDDWAARWPDIVPGNRNSESNWLTFTALIAAEHWYLLDYAAEDFCELVEHYYWPRVKRYLGRMRELIQAGKDISGETGLPFRISDWAPPQGKVPWSPYGSVTEPELMEGDRDLAISMIRRGTVSGQYEYYQGTLDQLAQEMLHRFPVPDDLAEVVTEPEQSLQALREQVLQGKPGDQTMGFHTPHGVEQVQVSRELGYLVAVEKLSEFYNVMRASVSSYHVHVSDYIQLVRLQDERSPTGDHTVTVFGFEVEERRYRLRYDAGSEHVPASLRIDTDSAQSPATRTAAAGLKE